MSVEPTAAAARADELAARARFFSRAMPEGYAQEWAQVLRTQPEAAVDKGAGHLVFRLGAGTFALPVPAVLSVTQPQPLCRLPQYVDSPFLGLVAVEGEVIPCCSLAMLLGMPREPAEPTSLLVLLEEKPGEHWAFVADEVLSVSQGSVQAAASGGPYAEWSTTAIHSGDGRDALLLRPEQIFQAMAAAVL